MTRTLFLAVLGLIVAGCAGRTYSEPTTHSTEPSSVIGRTWQWEATVTPVEKIRVPDPERYTILLTADGKVQASIDCNRGGGDYRIGEGTLTFGPMLSTRMACPPDSLDHQFMRDLQRVVSFFVDNDTLYLELPYDSGTMKFAPEK
jgi:heat shock protein HslJ